MPLKLRNTVVNTWLLLSALVILLAACSKSTGPSIRTFASPDEADKALIATAKSGDQAAVIAIFGPDSKQLLASGDAVEDKNAITAFISRYDVMHRWRKLGDGAEML